MILTLGDSLREMLPLLIFILLPLLGRLLTWLTQRAQAAQGQSRPKVAGKPKSMADLHPWQSSTGSRTQPQDEPPPLAREKAMQAFLEPRQGASGTWQEEPAQELGSQQVPRGDLKAESESLAGQLYRSVDLDEANLGAFADPIMAFNPKQRSAPQGSSMRLVQASATSDRAWGEASSAPLAKDLRLSPNSLRQAMIWHEILSKPVSLREAEAAF